VLGPHQIRGSCEIIDFLCTLPLIIIIICPGARAEHTFLADAAAAGVKFSFLQLETAQHTMYIFNYSQPHRARFLCEPLVVIRTNERADIIMSTPRDKNPSDAIVVIIIICHPEQQLFDILQTH